MLISRPNEASLCKRDVHKGIKLAIGETSHARDLGKLRPSGNPNVLKKADAPQLQMRMFFCTSSQDLALGGIRRCFNSFASFIRRYSSFCELCGCPPPPVREQAILGAIAIFKPVGTFPNYAGRIREKCFFFQDAYLGTQLWSPTLFLLLIYREEGGIPLPKLH